MVSARNRFLLSLVSVLSVMSLSVHGQSYVGRFLRADSLPIVFNMEINRKSGNGMSWVIRNAGETILVDDIRKKGDSLVVNMPFFESEMRLSSDRSGVIHGSWIKGTTSSDIIQPVEIRPGKVRFPFHAGPAMVDVTGRWSVRFRRPDGSFRNAVAEFKQQGSLLTGTFLTPTGDYRYLEGVVSGDSLQLSCFDGSHAYFFGARMSANGMLHHGVFAAGLTHLEPWTAIRDEDVVLDGSMSVMTLLPGQDSLRFRFKDLEGNWVSLRDLRYRDKVVIVQIMGSWCPNCMDETAFLSNYYRKHREEGIEVVALAYEYTTEPERARKSLMKFRDRFDVRYPMLITGVTSADSLRTEKTLPELTPIKAFPTTIFVGRDGKVKHVHPGYSGPATGLHHESFLQEFERIVRDLKSGTGH
jgi:thiol-disulfide isomerase/thioredoxin